MPALTERGAPKRRATRPVPEPAPRVRRRSTWAAAVLAIPVAVGVLLTTTGSSPVVLLLATTLAMVVALARRWSWSTSLGGTTLLLTALLCWLLQLNPLVGMPYAAMITLVLGLLGAGATASLLLGPADVRLPSRRQALLGLACTAVPAAWLIALASIQAAATLPKVSWRMFNDSVWNLLQSRIVLLDNGVDAALHTNPAPVTAGAVGAFLAPGRDDVSPAGQLAFDLSRSGQALAVAMAVLSVLVAVVAVRGLANRPGTAVAAALLGGLLPFTWLVSGFAFQYGFWNAIFAAVLLAATWLVWLDARRSPTLTSALLALSALGLVATWAPLLVVPGGLWAALVATHLRQHLRLRGWRLALWLAAHVAPASYVVVVTLADLDAQGTALAFDGAYFTPRLSVGVVAAALAFAAAVLAARHDRNGRWVLLGAASGLAACGAGIGYLMWQRHDSPTGLWGYYPAKLAWLVIILSVIVVLSASAVLAAQGRATRFSGLGPLLAGAIVAAVVMTQLPPLDPRPASAVTNPTPRPMPDYRFSSIFPILSIASRDGASDFDDAAAALVAHSDPRRKVLFSRYFEDPSRDGFVNFFLLQQPAVQGMEDLRGLSYVLDPQDAASVCGVVTAWGPGVEVQTTARGWERELRQACPDAEFSVETSASTD